MYQFNFRPATYASDESVFFDLEPFLIKHRDSNGYHLDLRYENRHLKFVRVFNKWDFDLFTLVIRTNYSQVVPK